jgi:hypothetical protein
LILTLILALVLTLVLALVLVLLIAASGVEMPRHPAGAGIRRNCSRCHRKGEPQC